MSDLESSSSSSSDDEDAGEDVRHSQSSAKEDVAGDDDEDGAAGAAGPDSNKTKNEVTEVKVTIPDIEEVGPDEGLEKVGEVMSIMDKVVIIKGLSSGKQTKASERALDSDTLLVFDDRKVLGYVRRHRSCYRSPTQGYVRCGRHLGRPASHSIVFNSTMRTP